MNEPEAKSPMSDDKKCQHCGRPLPESAPAGLCPACLLAQGVAADTITGGGASFSSPSAEELAALFPQLEILEFIGKGGMGVVYKARQKQLDRIVALKILPPGIGNAPAFAERFTREARALAKLNHPGIVTLYEFGTAAGGNTGTAPLYYFLMEYVDGVNLRQLLRAGRISAREALAIVPQICDALQFAHDNGIVHRDIKPENILLDRRGRVKVADFGLAKLMGTEALVHPMGAGNQRPGESHPLPSLTDAGKVMGTPYYMAPEQMENPGEVDHRADIYALGVVFYQMLTGELPEKQIQPPSKKVQIDVRLDEIVLRALEKKPELRFQQASVLKTQVETVAAENLNPEIRIQKPEARPRFSRKAAAGFCFGMASVLLFGFGFLANDLATKIPFPDGTISMNKPAMLVTLVSILVGAMFLLISIAFSWIAVAQIKRSDGKLFGAGFATMSGLMFPSLDLVMAIPILIQILSTHHVPHAPIFQNFSIGQTWFPNGDSIEITSVNRTKNQMIVKGRYNLISHSNALLALYITTTNDISVRVNTTQIKQISKGRGKFELLSSHLVPGLPHVSMYDESGEPFASIYFGNKEEAAEERNAGWITKRWKHLENSGPVHSGNSTADGYPGDWIWDSENFNHVPPVFLLRSSTLPKGWVPFDMMGKDRYLARGKSLKELIERVWSQKNSALKIIFEADLPKDKFDFIVAGQPDWWKKLESEINRRFYLDENVDSRENGKVVVVKNAPLNDPPKLQFLAWQDEWKTNKPFAAWHPDGSPVTNTTELDWLRHINSGGMDVSSWHLSPEPRFLHLWFSHPFFDANSLNDVALLDDDGQAIIPSAGGSMSGSEQNANEDTGNLGWYVKTFSPGAGTNIPQQVTVQLRYTIGPLEKTQTISVIPQNRTIVGLEGNSVLGGIGQNVDGQAFVSIAVNKDKMKSRQFGVIAITKGGRRLITGGSIGGYGVRTAEFDFNVPLADVSKFIIGTRPIRTVEWTNVILPEITNTPTLKTVVLTRATNQVITISRPFPPF
ncbi:MAG TPA: serine/threonine-protein kinase [Verrucomicrobiae bacterium]|nr:serine/threonine-protein kinase [Verrucomicrobiae bacterium]